MQVTVTYDEQPIDLERMLVMRDVSWTLLPSPREMIIAESELKDATTNYLWSSYALV